MVFQGQTLNLYIYSGGKCGFSAPTAKNVRMKSPMMTLPWGMFAPTAGSALALNDTYCTRQHRNISTGRLRGFSRDQQQRHLSSLDFQHTSQRYPERETEKSNSQSAFRDVPSNHQHQLPCHTETSATIYRGSTGHPVCSTARRFDTR